MGTNQESAGFLKTGIPTTINGNNLPVIFTITFLRDKFHEIRDFFLRILFIFMELQLQLQQERSLLNKKKS